MKKRKKALTKRQRIMLRALRPGKLPPGIFDEESLPSNGLGLEGTWIEMPHRGN